MTEKMLKKREYLRGLSKTAETMAEGTDYEEETVNNKLMKFIYNPTGALEFRSFKKWKEQKFTVRKGQKAFLLWGQPLENDKNSKDKDKKKESATDEEDNTKFFPVAYVFSSDQVHKIKKKEPAKA